MDGRRGWQPARVRILRAAGLPASAGSACAHSAPTFRRTPTLQDSSAWSQLRPTAGSLRRQPACSGSPAADCTWSQQQRRETAAAAALPRWRPGWHGSRPPARRRRDAATCGAGLRTATVASWQLPPGLEQLALMATWQQGWRCLLGQQRPPLLCRPRAPAGWCRSWLRLPACACPCRWPLLLLLRRAPDASPSRFCETGTGCSHTQGKEQRSCGGTCTSCRGPLLPLQPPSPPARADTRLGAPSGARGCRPRCGSASQRSRHTCAGRWWRRSQVQRTCGAGARLGRREQHRLAPRWPARQHRLLSQRQQLRRQRSEAGGRPAHGTGIPLPCAGPQRVHSTAGLAAPGRPPAPLGPGRSPPGG